MRLLPVLSPLLAAGVLASPAAAAPAALKAPAPAAGAVAVVVAPVKSGTPKLSAGAVPKGTVVTGGVAGKVAVVAVVRPAGAPKVAPRIAAGRRVKLGAAKATGDAFGADIAPALRGAAAKACPSGGLTKALGHVLRAGAGAPSGAQLAALGRALSARICSATAPDAALLQSLNLTAPAAPPAAAKAPAAPVAAAGAFPAAPTQPAPPSTPTTPTRPTTPTPPADSAKVLPATCGAGVTTSGSRVGFRVDVDGRVAGCPNGFKQGTVTFAGATVTFCDNSGWNDGEGNAACKTTGGSWTIYAGQGDAFHGNGIASASLCGMKATVVATDNAGQAWKREMTVTDAVGACTGPLPPAGAPQCSDGIDNDADGQIDAAGAADSGPDPGCASASDNTEAASDYPSTGCWNYVAADPDDPTIAYIYVLAGQAQDASCPTMDGAVVSFNYRHITACLSQPYWGTPATAAGTCTVKNGDAWLSGGSGQRIFAAVKVDGPVGCDAYAPGAMEMHAGGVWHEAISWPYTFDDNDNLATCPLD